MAGVRRADTWSEEALSAIRDLLPRLGREDVLARHGLGRILLRAVSVPDAHGSRAVERLAEDLRVAPDMLYRAASVATAWTEEEMRELVTRTNGRGERLSWSHWVALAGVRTIPGRRRWTEQCFAEAWSVRELLQRIAGERDDKDGLMMMRTTVTEGLRAVRRATVDMDVLLDGLESRALDGVDEELVVQTLSACDELREKLQRARARLTEGGRGSGRRMRAAGASEAVGRGPQTDAADPTERRHGPKR